MDPQTYQKSEKESDIVIDRVKVDTTKNKMQLMYKLEKTKSSVEFLSSCLHSNVIPQTFKDKRIAYGLCDEEKIQWNEAVTTTSRLLMDIVLKRVKEK